MARLGTHLQHSFLPLDVSGPKSFFSAPNIGPRFQAVLRPFLWSPQFNAHKLAGFRVVARAESALLLNNDHCPGPQKGPALLPPYTTGIVRIRSNLDIKLGRVIGGWQWRAADRRCASRCGRSSRGASGFGVAFVVSAHRQSGRRPAITELEDQQSGKSAGPKPRAPVLVLQFCIAYPHFHSNGSAPKREHSPQPGRMCCNPLPVALSVCSAPALHISTV